MGISSLVQRWRISAPPISQITPAQAQQALSGRGGGNANTGHPTHISHAAEISRFRSFAERFMVARAHLLRADPDGLKEDMWQCILDAKTAYKMIERTGQNIQPDDGVNF